MMTTLEENLPCDGLPAVRQPSHVGSALLCIILPSPLPHYVLCSAGKPVLAWHPAVCSLLPCMGYCYWLGFSQAPPCTGANVLAGSSMHSGRLLHCINVHRKCLAAKGRAVAAAL